MDQKDRGRFPCSTSTLCNTENPMNPSIQTPAEESACHWNETDCWWPKARRKRLRRPTRKEGHNEKSVLVSSLDSPVPCPDWGERYEVQFSLGPMEGQQQWNDRSRQAVAEEGIRQTQKTRVCHSEYPSSSHSKQRLFVFRHIEAGFTDMLDQYQNGPQGTPFRHNQYRRHCEYPLRITSYSKRSKSFLSIGIRIHNGRL